MGLDPSFSIAPTDLKSKYKSLMKELHPDKHSNSSREERAAKASQATDVTRAYDVLNNPLSRALHLLELRGLRIDEGDSSIIDATLLQEIMELREDIENASTDNELRPLLTICQTKQEELITELEKAFAELKMEEAKYLTAKLQYWKRIEETILEKITEV